MPKETTNTKPAKLIKNHEKRIQALEESIKCKHCPEKGIPIQKDIEKLWCLSSKNGTILMLCENHLLLLKESDFRPQ